MAKFGKFSRKHYEEIAEIIGNSNISDADITLLTGFFKSDNNKFDSIENENYRISVESSPERALPREIQAPPPPSMALEYVN